MPRIKTGILLVVTSIASTVIADPSAPVSLLQSSSHAVLATRKSLASTLAASQLASANSSNRCTFDHSGLDKVLQKFVKKPQLVEDVRSSLFDYEGLLASDDYLGTLHKYVESLASFKPSCLSANGKLAFWANTYNAAIIHLVVREARHSGGRLPKSVKDLNGNEESVWARQAAVVDGKAMTLEGVLAEARSLGDPRIHAAVNCASLSCPDLRSSVYTANDIQGQLDTQVKKWLTNPTKGAKVEGNKVQLSPIFQWHAEDFPSLSSFVAGPLGLPSSVQVAGYLEYDWNLNVA